MLWQALGLGLGYNATLVTLGATMLGIAAGATGVFLYLARRALVSDAIGHATLPGVVAAFLVMVALGGEGRFLPGLMLGAALSAGLGLVCVSWLTARTRLQEDAAIGAVLSVFFGAGVVLLTVVQVLETGRQAGLETFLLGATAGMLRAEALSIAAGGAAVLALVVLLRRPMVLAAFDPEHAAGQGINLRAVDLAMMGLALAVTVVGLKVVGVVLIVALLIIPPVAARLWSERVGVIVLLAGAIGGSSGARDACSSWRARSAGCQAISGQPSRPPRRTCPRGRSSCWQVSCSFSARFSLPLRAACWRRGCATGASSAGCICARGCWRLRADSRSMSR